MHISLFLLGQILARLEAPEAGLNLGGRFGGRLLALPHQEPAHAGLDLGGRFVLQAGRRLLSPRLRSGRPGRTTTSGRVAGGSSRLLVPDRLAHPVASEARLDLGGRVLLRGVRRRRVRRGRMDVHLVHYRAQSVHECFQRGTAVQRGDFRFFGFHSRGMKHELRFLTKFKRMNKIRSSLKIRVRTAQLAKVN